MISAHGLNHAGLTTEESALLRALTDDERNMGASRYANIDIAKIFTEIIADRAGEAATSIRATLARMDVSTRTLDPELERNLNGAETRLRQVRYVIERALNFLRTARGASTVTVDGHGRRSAVDGPRSRTVHACTVET